MNLCVSNIAWSGLGTNQSHQRDELVRNGISSVELAPALTWLNPDKVTSKQNGEVREFWGSQGIEINALQSLFFGRPDLQLFEDKGNRRAMFEYFAALANSAAEIGASVLVFGSPKNRIKGEMSKAEADLIALDFFGELSEEIDDLDVVIAIEPNPPIYFADYLVSAQEVIDFVKVLNRENIRMNFDLACSFLASEDPSDMLQKASEFVAHIHISEPNLGPISELRMPHEKFAQAIEQNRKSLQGVTISMEMRDPTPHTNLVSDSISIFKEIYDF